MPGRELLAERAFNAVDVQNTLWALAKVVPLRSRQMPCDVCNTLGVRLRVVYVRLCVMCNVYGAHHRIRRACVPWARASPNCWTTSFAKPPNSSARLLFTCLRS